MISIKGSYGRAIPLILKFLEKYIKKQLKYKDYTYTLKKAKIGITDDIYITSDYEIRIGPDNLNTVHLDIGNDSYLIGLDTNEVEAESTHHELMGIGEIKRYMPEYLIWKLKLELYRKDKPYESYLKKSGEYIQELRRIGIMGTADAYKKFGSYMSGTKLCKNMVEALEDFLYKRKNSFIINNDVFPQVSGYRSFIPVFFVSLRYQKVYYWEYAYRDFRKNVKSISIYEFIEDGDIGKLVSGISRCRPCIPYHFCSFVSKSKYLIEYEDGHGGY